MLMAMPETTALMLYRIRGEFLEMPGSGSRSNRQPDCGTWTRRPARRCWAASWPTGS